MPGQMLRRAPERLERYRENALNACFSRRHWPVGYKDALI